MSYRYLERTRADHENEDEQSKIEQDWSQYYRDIRYSTSVPKPFVHLIEQIENSTQKKEKRALDVGAGAGRYSLFLGKRKNWYVTATDSRREAVTIIEHKINQRKAVACDVLQHDIIHDALTPAMKSHAYVLILLNQVLPFMTEQNVLLAIQKLAPLLDQRDGYLYATFFGLKHEWYKKPNVFCLSRQKIETLFEKSGFPIERISIDETVEKTMSTAGESVVWHKIACLIQPGKTAY